MIRQFFAGALLSIPILFPVHAGVVSGFESGLVGWEVVGDVSAQTAAIGLDPTQGAKTAFLSNAGLGGSPFQVKVHSTTWQDAFLGCLISHSLPRRSAT